MWFDCTYVQRQREIRIETDKKHKKSANKIINGGLPLAIAKRICNNENCGREGSTYVRALNYGSGVFDGQLRRHSEYGVLVNAVNHWKC